ncbi:ubiquitin fusion degradation protein UFD1-domain-containing protein [Lipomyces orientalis]|uniref:Ubiquitin fusion degradation protein UFD1-domain-containing protein n=1 Tax=Lipomyces orientalis TaxID=1233043 RepID=A0ACC3TXT4_9ASCO
MTTPASSTVLVPHIRGALAHSDRIVLPQSVLEQLLSEAGRESLPSPLTFRVFNPATNAYTHCGVREFSAPESTVLISPQIASTLGISEKQLQASSSQDVSTPPVLQVSKCDLPKGTFVSLCPLDTNYLTIDDNWKALLESALQASYTTLTEGQTFSIVNPATQETITLLVNNLQPEKAVCIVETDLTVDITAMSEDHARKSVAHRDAKRKVQSGKVSTISQDAPVRGTFSELRQVFLFELKSWDRSRPVIVKLEVLDAEDSSERDIDARAADVFVSIDKHPSKDDFLWSTQTDEKNDISIAPSNSFLATAEKITLAVRTCVVPLSFSLLVSQREDVAEQRPAPALPSESRECPNCKQFFPPRTFQLHTAFCERNNLLCPHLGCGRIFRRQDGISASHWHCDLDSFSCDSVSTKEKHILAHHTLATCVCGESFQSQQHLAHHRATICPQKLHICRFCHLRLPQESSPDSQSDLLAGYTGHESRCGTRTTDCPRCNRIVKLRDLDNHMQLHELQRVSAPLPRICANALCVRVVDDDPVAANSNSLGLCSSCFGPLYSPMHDPTGARLKGRIERRYFIQLTTGCKRSYCTNPACVTGRTNSNLPKLAPAEVAAMVKELTEGGKLEFCVDDGMTRRRRLVNWIGDDNEFARPWICRAVGEVGVGVEDDDPTSSEAKARSWLVENGVRITEVR